MSSTAIPLRRSSRPKKSSAVIEDCLSYPDGPPSTPLEHWIKKLDRQTFPSSDFARIDDVIVDALFSTKKNAKFYRALHTGRAFLDEAPVTMREEALDICNTFNRVAKSSTDSPAVASEVTDLLIKKYPNLFFGGSDPKILNHLLQRYHILRYSPWSNVRVDKVQFGSSRISCGLRATSNINASTVLLALCSSMSSDVVSDRPAVSLITSMACHSLAMGTRLILGPFRFANHDCNPNCQIMPIPKTCAYTLCTLRSIREGEVITVNYAKDGSYFDGAECWCASCRPDAPPVAKKRPINYANFIPDPNHKGRRRGGKRAKRRRLNPAEGVHSDSQNAFDVGTASSNDVVTVEGA